MKNKFFYLSTLIFFTFSISSFAETKVYHWIDKDGNSHFSDTPTAETEEVNLNLQNILPHQEVKKREASLASELQDSLVKYEATITSPEDDSSMRSNDGTINVHVSTTPAKENNHKLQLFLDGVALGDPQVSPTMRALNIDRGTHQVQVHLLDENANLLAKTQIVTVHLQRVNVGNLKALAK